MYNTDKVDNTYTLARIPKRSGKARILEIPSDTLKELQNKILEDVLYKMGTHKSAHGFVKGRNPITNAKVHNRARIIIKLDIKDFFRRTQEWTIKSSLKKNADYLGLTDEEIEQIIEYTMFDGHLPTGAPTSPALGNICLYNTDKALFAYCRANNLRYTRYADDITISSAKFIDKKTITGIIQEVQKCLKRRHHVLNYKKIKIFSTKNRMEITGIVINDKPNISKKYRANLRAAIHQAKTDEDFEKVEGRIAWVAQVAPKHAKKLSLLMSTNKQYADKKP